MLEEIKYQIYIALKEVLNEKFDVEDQASDEAIDAIIKAIAEGKIPHIKINY